MAPQRLRPKKPITLRLDAELVEEMRKFVKDYAGIPLYLTAASFVEQAITEHLVTLRRRLEISDSTAPGRDHRHVRNTRF